MASDVIVNRDGGESYLLEYYSAKVAIVTETYPRLFTALYFLVFSFVERADTIARELDASAKRKIRLGGGGDREK